MREYLTMLWSSDKELIQCECQKSMQINLIAEYSSKSETEKAQVHEELNKRNLSFNEIAEPQMARWFCIIQPDTLRKLPYPYSSNCYSYVGANKYNEAENRILHACDKCIESLRPLLPENTTMNFYDSGIGAKVTQRFKGQKLYDLSI